VVVVNATLGGNSYYLDNPIQNPLETTHFHPTFAYEMLWNFLAFALITYLAHRLGDRLKPGAIFFAWLVLAGLGRFLIEFFRPDQPHLSNSWLSFTQIAAIAMMLIGLFMLAFRFGIFKLSGRVLPEKYQIAEQSV
jgi:phosphatidylglycerol:prolipoprotein diacylglycerol transferase